MSKLDCLRALPRPLLCLILMSCQFACQKQPSIGLAPPGAFFPLVPGTTWKYRITDELKNSLTTYTDKVERLPPGEHGGEQLADNSNGDKTLETVVTENFESDSRNQLVIVYKENSGYIERSFSFGNLEDGSFDNRILSTEPDFLPRLLKPGLTWSNTTFPFGNFLQDLKIVQRHAVYTENDVVTVPAGQFSGCLRIQTNTALVSGTADAPDERQRLRYIDWYAPNVGLIKTSLWETGLFGKEIARVELVKFSRTPTANPPSSIVAPAHHPTAYPRLMD